MVRNEERPDRREPIQGELFFYDENKGTPKLSYRQKKVVELLCTGKYSAADISIRLGYCDPRSYIRDLRVKGIDIQDEWIEDEDTRFKRYWLL